MGPSAALKFSLPAATVIQVADAQYDRADRNRQLAYAETQLSLAAASHITVGSERDGLAVVQPAPFDSECLQLSMAKLAWLAAPLARQRPVLESAIERARQAGFEHVAVRFRADNIAFARAVGDAGFYIGDVQVTFRSSTSREDTNRGGGAGVAVIPYSGDRRQREAILRMASDIFRNSRYYSDPVLNSERVDFLHRRWVENSCGGRADRVLVATSGDEVLGFVACLFSPGHAEYGIAPIASIDLIGVAPEAQGRGVGTALMYAAIEAYAGRSPEIQVGTQAYNFKAIRLYTRCGFQIAKSEFTFHWSPRRERR